MVGYQAASRKARRSRSVLLLYATSAGSGEEGPSNQYPLLDRADCQITPTTPPGSKT